MNPLATNRSGCAEAFDLEIMHLVVEVEGRRMAVPTLPLPKEDVLAQALFLRRPSGIQRPERRQLRGRREIEHVLHLGHHGDLAGPSGEMDPFFGGRHLVTIEVGSALFKLSEVLDRAERPLRTVEALVEHAAQAYRVDPKSRRLRAIVGVQVEGAIGVTVYVAIKTGNTDHSIFAFSLSIVSRVELLLWKLRYE